MGLKRTKFIYDEGQRQSCRQRFTSGDALQFSSGDAMAYGQATPYPTGSHPAGVYMSSACGETRFSFALRAGCANGDAVRSP